MALNNFTSESTVFTVNGRRITDWGHSSSPIDITPINPLRAMIQGHGGSAISTGRINQGMRVTLNILPGSPDSKYLHTLYKAGVPIIATYSIIGSNEFANGAEGVMTNMGTTGRAGQDTNVTDDQYIMEFNIWEDSKGGN